MFYSQDVYLMACDECESIIVYGAINGVVEIDDSISENCLKIKDIKGIYCTKCTRCKGARLFPDKAVSYKKRK